MIEQTAAEGTSEAALPHWGQTEEQVTDAPVWSSCPGEACFETSTKAGPSRHTSKAPPQKISPRL